MAQWKIQQDKTKAPTQHRAQLKVTATAEGLRLESAYPFRPGSLAAEPFGFADGSASLELSRAELQQVRASLGAGLINVVNKTEHRLHVAVAVAELEDGQPVYQLTVVEEDEPEETPVSTEWDRPLQAPPALPQLERFVRNGQQASERVGQLLGEPSGAVVSSSDGLRPSKAPKKRGRPRGKPGRPKSVRPASA